MEKVVVHDPHSQHPERGLYEASRLHRITDTQLLDLIACPGFTEKFNMGSATLPDSHQMVVNPETNAAHTLKIGDISDKKGRSYPLRIIRDLDSVSIQVDDPKTQTSIVKVGLRDREFDGTPNATSPTYLQTIGNVPSEEVSQRSKMLGNVSWHYSSEAYDRPEPGRKAVEISVVASDPDFHLAEPLRQKAARRGLWVENADMLAQFIDDPFAALPQDAAQNLDKLNDWYTQWWQVTSRILKGKNVPLPGQTSQKAFNGFLEHAVDTSVKFLRDHGFTHLSAVPTWEYVWTKFQRLGFQPDHLDIHQASEDFFSKVTQIASSHPLRRTEQVIEINQKALQAWLSVLPYAMQLAPQFTPQLSIPAENANSFHQVFQMAKEHFVAADNTVQTYPLAPGRNVWYSLAI